MSSKAISFLKLVGFTAAATISCGYLYGYGKWRRAIHDLSSIQPGKMDPTLPAWEIANKILSHITHSQLLGYSIRQLITRCFGRAGIGSVTEIFPLSKGIKQPISPAIRFLYNCCKFDLSPPTGRDTPYKVREKFLQLTEEEKISHYTDWMHVALIISLLTLNEIPSLLEQEKLKYSNSGITNTQMVASYTTSASETLFLCQDVYQSLKRHRHRDLGIKINDTKEYNEDWVRRFYMEHNPCNDWRGLYNLFCLLLQKAFPDNPQTPLVIDGKRAIFTKDLIYHADYLDYLNTYTNDGRLPLIPPFINGLPQEDIQDPSSIRDPAHR